MNYFNDVITRKIEQMEHDGLINQRIENDVEESLYRCIDNIFKSSWSDFNKEIEEKIEREVSYTLKNLDFSSLQEVAFRRAQEFVNSIFQNEITKKFNEKIKELLTNNYTGITINDIYNDFVEMIKDMSYDLCDREQLIINDDLECHFTFNIEDSDNYYYDSIFKHYILTIMKNDEPYIEARFSLYDQDSKANLYILTINENIIDKIIDLNGFNDFELKLINLYLSRTEIDFGKRDWYFEESVYVEPLDDC